MNGSNGVLRRILDEAMRFHGHLCGGLTLGVRMAIAGLGELGINDPKGHAGKDLVIFVETDRCPVDGIIAVTGRTPGKRSIKMMDYGKNAATFIETQSGDAVRVSVRADFNEKVERLAKTSFREMKEKRANVATLTMIPEADLLRLQRVSVKLCPEDLPGKPLVIVTCQCCGEIVRDNRHVNQGNRLLCKPCATGVDYYTLPGDELRPLGHNGFIESELKRKHHEPAGR